MCSLTYWSNSNRGSRSYICLLANRCWLPLINHTVRRRRSNGFTVRWWQCNSGTGYNSTSTDLYLRICRDETPAAVSPGNGIQQHLPLTVAPDWNEDYDGDAQKSDDECKCTVQRVKMCRWVNMTVLHRTKSAWMFHLIILPNCTHSSQQILHNTVKQIF